MTRYSITSLLSLFLAVVFLAEFVAATLVNITVDDSDTTAIIYIPTFLGGRNSKYTHITLLNTNLPIQFIDKPHIGQAESLTAVFGFNAAGFHI